MEIPFTDNNAGLRELYFVPQEEESEFINPSAHPRVYSHGHLMQQDCKSLLGRLKVQVLNINLRVLARFSSNATSLPSHECRSFFFCLCWAAFTIQVSVTRLDMHDYFKLITGIQADQ